MCEQVTPAAAAQSVWTSTVAAAPHISQQKTPGHGLLQRLPLAPCSPCTIAVPRMGQSPWLDTPGGTRCRMSCSEPSWPHLAPKEGIWQLLIPLDFQQYLMDPQMFSLFVQWPELPGAQFLQIPQVKGFLPPVSPVQAAARTRNLQPLACPWKPRQGFVAGALDTKTSLSQKTSTEEQDLGLCHVQAGRSG